MKDQITLKNAHLNNLKNLNLSLPKNKKVVFCGISGSGKSTLVFDTIFKEGQKRYIESLSSYARQYLDYYSENKIDSITGLSPSISIDQKSRVLNPRSTVGTLTEVTDNLRILFSTIGKISDDQSKIAFKKESEILDYVIEKKFKNIIIAFNQKNNDAIEKLHITKFLNPINFEAEKRNQNSLCLFDKFSITEKNIKRFKGDLQLLGDLKIKEIFIFADLKKYHFSRNLKISKSNINFDRLTASHFSYNSPKGSCEKCKGLGEVIKINIELLFDEPEKNILDGGSTFLTKKSRLIILRSLSSFLNSNNLPNIPFFEFLK
mgnify:CR=1 FL=1